MSATISKDRLAELLAKARAEKVTSPITQEILVEGKSSEGYTTQDRYGNLITYNKEQAAFLDTIKHGKSAVLIGAAGTGKTTVMRGTLESLLSSNSIHIPPIQDAHKHLPSHAPGIVIIAYTRRAITNIKKVLPEELKSNAITYHKLMEYEPSFFEVEDPNTGELRNTMQFLPGRNGMNPLPKNIKVIIVEEASMLSIEYYELLMKALNHEVQFIFLGDIYQLPPIFGPAILGYKMVSETTVELKTVYRQALESPIIKFATDIRQGVTTSISEKSHVSTNKGILTLHPWAKKLKAEDAVMVASKFMLTMEEKGFYNPYEDVILIPFNKAFGTIEINAAIGTHLAKKEDKEVHEVIAGFNKHYFRIGERIMFDKEDAEILEIIPNPSYGGVMPQKPSKLLDYWGSMSGTDTTHELKDSDEELDFILNQVVAGDKEDRVHAASHKIRIRYLDRGETTIVLDSAADINKILLGYAITVHKAQGSEWQKVFLLLHNSHATMVSRELLYTAVTRARTELYVICEKDTFVSGVKSQRIKGNTLAEKSEYFKGRIENNKR